MQAFSFDGVQPGQVPVAGAVSMAGRQAAKPGQAPAAAPQQSGGLFGMFGGGGAAPAAAAQVPPDKENQDGVVLVPNLYDGVGMYLVFDGHGEYGLSVTNWVTKNLPAYVAGAVAEGRPGQLLNRVTDAYRLADRALQEALGYDTVEDSGTTAALVLTKGSRLLVGGLGDSRVVLGVDNGDGSLGAQAVTLDQSPIVPAEEQRIVASGGEVRDEGTSGRIYAAGQPWPGLAVSRAFGDADAKQYGVTVDPQFIGWNRRPQDFCLILASDGVWNAMGNDAAVQYANDYRQTKDSKAAAKAIVETSREIWEEMARGRIDDITCLVIYF